jgi:hypothetical protein
MLTELKQIYRFWRLPMKRGGATVACPIRHSEKTLVRQSVLQLQAVLKQGFEARSLTSVVFGAGKCKDRVVKSVGILHYVC